MDSIESLLFGLFNTTGNEEKVARDKVNDYVVDTCYTVDQGYETAIWKEERLDRMIITQRYKTKKDAIDGHSLWVEYCELNPLGAYSVQLDRVALF